MYVVFPSKDFKKSVQKLRRSGKFKEKILEDLLKILQSGEDLPGKYNDHAMSGDLIEFRLCHLRGDLILQYKRDDVRKIIVLDDIGSHHQLLGR